MDINTAWPDSLVASYGIDTLVTEYGCATVLMDITHHDYKYSAPLGGWFSWNGVRWQLDENAIWHAVAELGQRMMTEAATTQRDIGDRLYRQGRHLESAAGAGNVISLAKRDPRIHRSPDQFDANPYHLNTLSGTVDLRTGELLPHDRDHLITKLAPVEYQPDAPLSDDWEGFLKTILQDTKLRSYVQRSLGYSATGDVREEAFFVAYGVGANGKGTLIETVKTALGDYAHRTKTELLLMKRADNGPTPDLANLKGRRFVFASESDEGQRLAEGMVKDLTGGDTINARRLHKAPMEFAPTHKLWLQTNHEPQIRGNDAGIWRRVKKIPFSVQIPENERDNSLKSTLKREQNLIAVLNWIVQGAVQWYEGGLREPEIVKSATNEYRESQDKIGLFISEECEFNPAGIVFVSELYKEYKDWCLINNEYIENNRRFTSAILERNGVRKDRQTSGVNKGKAIYVGISLQG